MPLTASGKRVLAKMRKTYGKAKGTRVFHASISEKKKGSSQWHAKRKKKTKKG